MIKFMVWDHVARKFVGASSILQKVGVKHGGNLVVIGETDDQGLISGRFEIIRFTGFHDKNGREIYDKDYLRSEDKSLNLVIFDSKSGVWNIQNDDTYNDDLSYFAKDMEVVEHSYEAAIPEV